jgi:hypothetical protein
VEEEESEQDENDMTRGSREQAEPSGTAATSHHNAYLIQNNSTRLHFSYLHYLQILVRGKGLSFIIRVRLILFVGCTISRCLLMLTPVDRYRGPSRLPITVEKSLSLFPFQSPLFFCCTFIPFFRTT